MSENVVVLRLFPADFVLMRRENLVLVREVQVLLAELWVSLFLAVRRLLFNRDDRLRAVLDSLVKVLERL